MPLYSSAYAIPYIIFFLFVFCFSIKVVSINNKELNKSWSCLQTYALVIGMLFFIGFRGFIETDWKSYYDLYEMTPTLFDGEERIKFFFTKSLWATKEKGFMLWTLILKTISSNYVFYQFVNFAVDFFVFWKLAEKYTPNHKELCIVFVLMFGCLEIFVNLLRNSKSILLFALSLEYAYKKNWKIYFLINGFGILMHTTAIIYFPLYFFIRKQHSKKLIIGIFVFGVTIFTLKIQWIRRVLEFIVSFMPTQLRSITSYYLSEEHTTFGFSIGYFERIFSFCFVMFFQDKLLKKNPANIVIINVFYIFIFIYLYLSEMSLLITRIPKLFIFSYWFLYPQLYECLSKKRKYFFMLCVLFYGLLRMSRDNKFVNKYDNMLDINHMTYNERAYLLRNEDKLDTGARKVE